MTDKTSEDLRESPFVITTVDDIFDGLERISGDEIDLTPLYNIPLRPEGFPEPIRSYLQGKIDSRECTGIVRELGKRAREKYGDNYTSDQFWEGTTDKPTQ